MTDSLIKVNVEYCGMCNYGGHCLSLAKKLKETIPKNNVDVVCTRGRQGSFEITINDVHVYSKLQTMALPDFDEVVAKVKIVAEGGTITPILNQQPITCNIS